jgi:hypothetical protein
MGICSVVHQRKAWAERQLRQQPTRTLLARIPSETAKNREIRQAIAMGALHMYLKDNTAAKAIGQRVGTLIFAKEEKHRNEAAPNSIKLKESGCKINRNSESYSIKLRHRREQLGICNFSKALSRIL